MFSLKNSTTVSKFAIFSYQCFRHRIASPGWPKTREYQEMWMPKKNPVNCDIMTAKSAGLSLSLSPSGQIQLGTPIWPYPPCPLYCTPWNSVLRPCVLNPKKTLFSLLLKLANAYWNYACWMQVVMVKVLQLCALSVGHFQCCNMLRCPRCPRCPLCISSAVRLLPLLVGRGAPIAFIQLAGTHKTSITSVRTTNRNPVLEVQCFSNNNACLPFAASDREVLEPWPVGFLDCFCESVQSLGWFWIPLCSSW